MRTLNEELKVYAAACYPNGYADHTQEEEVRQAFYAGALTMLGLINKGSQLPENQAVIVLERLSLEIALEHQRRSRELKTRQNVAGN